MRFIDFDTKRINNRYINLHTEIVSNISLKIQNIRLNVFRRIRYALRVSSKVPVFFLFYWPCGHFYRFHRFNFEIRDFFSRLLYSGCTATAKIFIL